MRIAVIGLGTMGGPMAANLVEAGMEVVVHNRTRRREAPLVELGATAAGTPAEAAAQAEIVLICVSDTPDVEHLVLDPDHGVATTLASGGLVIDCSTIAPEGARKVAAALLAKGIGFVDAPVSGGSEGAIHGTLAVMCGGSEEDMARARPVLEVLGKTVTHIGPVGCGQIAKAVNQVIIAGTYQSVAEGIALAHRAGADPAKVVAAIENGAAGSWILTNRAEAMQKGDYPLGFRVRLHRKDLRIALETAAEAGVPMPNAEFVAEVEDQLIEMGFGDDDVAAVARLVRRNAGIPDGPMSGER